MIRLRCVALLASTILVAAACRGATDPRETPCTAPAPLFGQADPRAPAFIVVYHDTVDATAETARLAARYSFRPTAVWASGLRGFAAPLTPQALASLRCESAVRYVAHEVIMTLGAGGP
jgi:hypothetical protein